MLLFFAVMMCQTQKSIGDWREKYYNYFTHENFEKTKDTYPKY